jgi:hypothetical protein
MVQPSPYKLFLCITIGITLGFTSCSPQPMPDTAAIENTYKKNSALFDTLVGWGFYETHGDKTTSFYVDSVPDSKKKYFLQLGIKNMIVQQHFCGTNKNGKGAVTFEFNETPHSNSYIYLLFNQDITDESRKYFTQHGGYQQLNNFWFLIWAKGN